MGRRLPGFVHAILCTPAHCRRLGILQQTHDTHRDLGERHRAGVLRFVRFGLRLRLEASPQVLGISGGKSFFEFSTGMGKSPTACKPIVTCDLTFCVHRAFFVRACMFPMQHMCNIFLLSMIFSQTMGHQSDLGFHAFHAGRVVRRQKAGTLTV